jgi:hypothetical protein
MTSFNKASFLEVIDNALSAATIVCSRSGADPPWKFEVESWAG